jgi:hypothetical protein
MLLYASPLPKHSSQVRRCDPYKLSCFAGKLLSILLGEGQVDTGKIAAICFPYEKQDFGIIVKVLLQLFNRKSS